MNHPNPNYPQPPFISENQPDSPGKSYSGKTGNTDVLIAIYLSFFFFFY
jgi:hypothetical protein